MAQPERDPFFDRKIKVMYTNYRGVKALRTITPKRIAYGRTAFHTEPQWLLECYDHNREGPRTYALKDCDFVNTQDNA